MANFVTSELPKGYETSSPDYSGGGSVTSPVNWPSIPAGAEHDRLVAEAPFHPGYESAAPQEFVTPNYSSINFDAPITVQIGRAHV